MDGPDERAEMEAGAGKKPKKGQEPVGRMENIEKGIMTAVALFGALYSSKGLRMFWADGLKGAAYMMAVVIAGFAIAIAILVLDVGLHPRKYDQRLYMAVAAVSCVLALLLAVAAGVFG